MSPVIAAEKPLESPRKSSYMHANTAHTETTKVMYPIGKDQKPDDICGARGCETVESKSSSGKACELA